MIHVSISESPLSVDNCYKLVEDPACGGIALFIGTVRNQTQSKNVLSLEFEAYKAMAIKEMEKIAITIETKWKANQVLIHHRTGILNVTDIAVIIIVSTPHRKAAFEACQYGIDTLKETVPIWKKEVFEDGEVWVAAHP